jgi:HKD family nuclease
MRTRAIIQPLESVMGEIIQEYLASQDPFYNNIWLVSAFANAQAIQRLTPSILAAKERGARISLVVGFDVNSTSAEALRNINLLGINSIVVHNARGGHTFHPKIYLFEASNLKAELFIGSNNLTDGGLYTNYEASSQTSFDFPQDAEEYAMLVASLDRYLNPQGATAKVLNDDLIEILVSRGDVPTEEEILESQRRTSNKRVRSELPASPFGVERINRPLRVSRRGSRITIRRTPNGNTQSEGGTNPINHGVLLWQKSNLPNSDAQQTRDGSNPTGGLRLTQAGWTIDGDEIDQTTYFRNDIFGNLVWMEWRASPYSEKAETNFDIYILGTSYGVHNLTISHKPSGEAGQGNYTTILHWGDLIDIIRQSNLVGKTLSLYAPPPGQAEPFTIEII